MKKLSESATFLFRSYKSVQHSNSLNTLIYVRMTPERILFTNVLHMTFDVKEGEEESAGGREEREEREEERR